MKVFISWSGARSKAVAEHLSDWLKCVIQAIRPWISTRDIDRGALWFSEINEQLKDTAVGIICLTKENKDRPWILFEAGALAKGLSSNRVCTLLIDLKSSDIRDPLAQFNHTFPERDSIWALVRTLNSGLGAISLDERVLIQVFNTYWKQFESGFRQAVENNQPTVEAEPRKETDILSEILDSTRSMQQRLSRLESNPGINVRGPALDGRRVPRWPRGVAKAHAKRWLINGKQGPEILARLSEGGYPTAESEVLLQEVLWALDAERTTTTSTTTTPRESTE